MPRVHVFGSFSLGPSGVNKLLPFRCECTLRMHNMRSRSRDGIPPLGDITGDTNSCHHPYFHSVPLPLHSKAIFPTKQLLMPPAPRFATTFFLLIHYFGFFGLRGVFFAWLVWFCSLSNQKCPPQKTNFIYCEKMSITKKLIIFFWKKKNLFQQTALTTSNHFWLDFVFPGG